MKFSCILSLALAASIAASPEAHDDATMGLDKRTFGKIGVGVNLGCGCGHFRRKRSEIEKRTFGLLKHKFGLGIGSPFGVQVGIGAPGCACGGGFIPPQIIQAPAPQIVHAPPPQVIQVPPPQVIQAPVPQIVQAPTPPIIQAPAPQTGYA